ncbi:MAG: NAD(P)-binding domain-containing protein [Anaerolineales bacterium]|nr:NAD(P)-binding domain-containing protein [Anaerolineales bacterium]
MNIGMLGTGMVGQAIGSRLVELGHNVMMGSRSAANENARAWVRSRGQLASHGSLSALEFPRRSDLNGKILVDLANPLDFSRGMPPTLTVCNVDSLGEQIQRAHPLLRVVKALNTVNVELMAHPELLHGPHDAFICGNDLEAKAEATRILNEWFGWKSVIDLGDISNSRGLEMALPLWISLQKKLGTNIFNFKIVK